MIKQLGFGLVFAALLVAGCGGSSSTGSVFEGLPPPPPSGGLPPENPPPVDIAPPPASAFTLGAYYYTWWIADEWKKGVSGASRYGEYLSADASVAANHVTDARAAGIGVFAVNWFGGISDSAFRSGLLAASNLDQIQFCIHYDIAIRFELANLALDLSKPVPRLAFLRDMHYLADNYMNHPRYYRVDGRPVLMIYLSRVITGDLEGILDQVRSELNAQGIDLYVVGDEVYDGNFRPERIRLFDAVTAYNLYNPQIIQERGIANVHQWAEVMRPTYRGWSQGSSTIPLKHRDRFADFMPSVIPQYNDTPVRCCNPPLPSESFDDFSSMLDMARSFARPVGNQDRGVIWITSWNEWHEGTTVEPSSEGTGSIGAGNYLFGFLQTIPRVFPDPVLQ